MGDGNTGSDIFEVLDFVVYGFTLPIICILIATRVCPNSTWDCPYGGPANDSQNGFIIYQSYVSPGAFEITDCTRHLQMAIWTSPSTSAMVTAELHNSVFNSANFTTRRAFKFDLTAGDFRSGNSQQSSPFFFRVRHSAVYHRNLLPTAGPIICQLHRLFIRAGAQPRELGTVSLDVTHARSQLADDSRQRGIPFASSMRNR